MCIENSLDRVNTHCHWSAYNENTPAVLNQQQTTDQNQCALSSTSTIVLASSLSAKCKAMLGLFN